VRRAITAYEVDLVVAVRGASLALRPQPLDRFLRDHPTAQVQDVADCLLAGVILEAKGPTSRAYQFVYYHLVRARKRLGLPPPWKMSVARYRRPEVGDGRKTRF
jgi:hypothetical protein